MVTNDKVHVGLHLDAVCEPCLEFRQQWSSAGGAHSAVKSMVETLRSRAGAAYARGQDTEARLLRSLADEWDRDVLEPARKKLQQFIDSNHLWRRE